MKNFFKDSWFKIIVLIMLFIIYIKIDKAIEYSEDAYYNSIETIESCGYAKDSCHGAQDSCEYTEDYCYNAQDSCEYAEDYCYYCY